MKTERLLLFLIGCIGMRILLVILAKSNYLRIPFSIIALMISIGFFYIYLTGSRKTGPETFGEKIWWNDLRPVHGTLYFLFGILHLLNYPYSWIILLLDVCIGLFAFLYFHIKNKDI